MIKHIADTQLEYIDKLMAKYILDALKRDVVRKSIVNQLYLRKKFFTLKYDENVHIKNHLLEFNKIVCEIKSTIVGLYYIL